MKMIWTSGAGGLWQRRWQRKREKMRHEGVLLSRVEKGKGGLLRRVVEMKLAEVG
jgi:hypothetical protein